MLYQFLDQRVLQGIVDGFASKPALRQDTGYYMVEKTDHDIAPYLGAFGAYLMPIYGSKGVSYTKTIAGTRRSTRIIFHLFKKPLVLVTNDSNRLYGLRKLTV